MIDQDANQKRRLLGGAAAIALVAALGGFAVARCSTDRPAGTETPAGNTTTAEPEEKAPDSVAMTAQAIQQAGISTETIQPGGLGAEIVAQATVSASPQGEGNARPPR